MVPSVFRSILLVRWTHPERINHFIVQSCYNHCSGIRLSKSCTQQHTRLLASSRSGKAYRKGRRKAATTFEKKQVPVAAVDAPTTTTTKIDANIAGSSSTIGSTKSQLDSFYGVKQWIAMLKSSNEPMWKTALLVLVPKRYRFPSGQSSRLYSYEQGVLIAQRLAMWTAIVLVMVVYDETSPFELVGIRGPSMIPTMAADGSDLWFCRTYPSWLRQYYDTSTNPALLALIQPRLRHGSIVGFAPPDCPNSAIAMKRIIGLPGDRVQRYGQYVHLYTDQDPIGLGITWPTTYDSNHIWIKNRGTTWDVGRTEGTRSPKEEQLRTLVVPDGHVWIEADCPALGLDSRQFGPIPISWIRTRVIAKIWPLQGSPTYKRWYHRPHPIPLDVETLMEFNVFHNAASEKLFAENSA